MTIGEILQINSPSIYKKLVRISEDKSKIRPKKVELGGSVENLMKVDSHKRVNGAIR